MTDPDNELGETTNLVLTGASGAVVGALLFLAALLMLPLVILASPILIPAVIGYVWWKKTQQ